ncbi:MAG: phosphatidate cytidylyltransferase [Coriobacteriales bacterium]|jgi:phosphatidate cytidylyltransferase|nr:phosphatidate cytidylyltransferase [Coriobacteriales bacterium]
MSNLKTRVITAFFYGGTMIIMTLASTWTTMIMCSVLSGLCAFELYAMLRSDAKLPNEIIGIVTAAAFPAAYFFWHFNGLLSLTVSSATVLLVWYVFYTPARITDVALTLFGSCYTGLLLSSLINIRDILPGFWGGVLVVGILLSVWANDAFAYFVGSKIGRHKLAPRISPNKSYEGFLAGVVGSVAAWSLLVFIPELNLTLVWAIVGGLFTGVMGILGDLVESRIKRATGFKDSSKLLPGHGGFLDRCDSLLIVAAITSLYFRVLGMI